MTPMEVRSKLDDLLKLPAEIEWVEFKEAKNTFHFNELGEYFSALSNEANLKEQSCSWLVFGVKDKPKQVVGSKFRPNRADLDHIKEEIANQTNNRMTFDEIYEVNHPDGRVVLFKIPPAMRGMPTSWKGHYFGRDNEALVPLSVHEFEQIRKQHIAADWSKEICENATLGDLDPAALLLARKEFKIKHQKLANEVAPWDDLTFLNKSKICVGGKITNTAILLLGRDESSHFLSTSVAQISWVLKDKTGIEQDYCHYGPPFLLAVDELFSKVRNLTIRHLPDGTLFPIEVSQYDPWVLRETLHNCIAHQDYSLRRAAA